MDSTVSNSTSSRPVTTGQNYDVVFTDETDNSILSPTAFLELMIVEMQNQDFTDPMDTGEQLAQMAQFTNLQMMEEMNKNSVASYAMSMVGKTVTASRFMVDGTLDTTTGVVEKVSMLDNEFVLYVGDKTYDLNQIMEVGVSAESVSGVDASKYSLSAKDIIDDSATVAWAMPTEDIVKASELKYTVYYSTDENFDSVAEVENGTQFGPANQMHLYEETLTGLQANTTYYVNVVVLNPDGTKSAYKPVEITTKM